jgi:hypothetical protein
VTYNREYTQRKMAAMTAEELRAFKDRRNELARIAKQNKKNTMPPEQWKEYCQHRNKLSKAAHKKKLARDKIFAMGSHLKGRISILWPGCADFENVSQTLFWSWSKQDIPAGTVVKLDGKVWAYPYLQPKKEG